MDDAPRLGDRVKYLTGEGFHSRAHMRGMVVNVIQRPDDDPWGGQLYEVKWDDGRLSLHFPYYLIVEAKDA